MNMTYNRKLKLCLIHIYSTTTSRKKTFVVTNGNVGLCLRMYDIDM